MLLKSEQQCELGKYVEKVAQQARAASRMLRSADTESRNKALLLAADSLQESTSSILEQNRLDLDRGKQSGLSAAMLDRLELTPARIENMVEGLHQVAQLPDPVGEVSDISERPSGIQVSRMRIPIGVIDIIYESQPNVTADAGALCLKSANAAVLRGGSESFHSNKAIAKCLHKGISCAGLHPHSVQYIDTTDRAAIDAMLQLDEFIDVIIPRGGKGLIERISANSRIPVIKHLDGNCHVYVDDHADVQKAVDIILNSKTHRYGVCNAAETLLVARERADEILPKAVPLLLEKGVELRGCDESRSLAPQINHVNEDDWYTEYLAPILAVRVVDGLEQAIQHIEKYGSAHTDSIVTEDPANAERFVREVDSSSVMVNASTRFSDGFEYGLGAEIGISTNKLHARGPVGLEGLTTQKFVVLGNGHVRT